MRTRFSWSLASIAPGLLLVFGGVACGGGSGGKKQPGTPDGGGQQHGGDAGGDGDTQGPDAGHPGGDAGMDGGGSDCITGCDEVGATCGTINDNCGGTIDCGDTCVLPQFCGGDPDLGPNACGCKPKTCADVVAGGAKCGDQLDNGCGGKIDTCGTCPGAQDICSETHQCVCAPDLTACDGKVCGQADSGCGMVNCGDHDGACEQGDCSADQSACECPDKATACTGHDGQLTLPNGCSYDCSVACMPDNVTACKGATCGTATNNCGDKVNCGASAGGCTTGNTCVDTTYITGTTVPKRSGGFQGGLCIDNDVANLIGTYGVRTHAYRRASTGSLSTNSRAEALSLVVITSNAAGTAVHMKDNGCSAKSTNFPGGISAKTDAPSYANIAAVDVDMTVAGNAGGTGGWTRPIAGGGAGVATGFALGMPAYCVGKEGMDVDLPENDTRSWFTDGADNGSALDCKCPLAADKNKLPTASGGAINEDCRIVDADADNKPGFTVNATVPLGTAASDNVSISQITWTGAIVASGYHTGLAIEPSPIQRSTVGCTYTGTGLAVCSGLAGTGKGSYDCSCHKTTGHNFIQFAPLDGVADPGNNGWSCADVGAQASTLFASFGSCTDATQCPANTLCTGGRCWPASTPGSCKTDDDKCPAQTACSSTDKACWPADSECSAPDDSNTDDCNYTVGP